MKKFIKVLVIVLFLFVLTAGGFAFYMTRGLEAGKSLTLDGVETLGKEDGAFTGKYNGGRWSNEVMVTIKAGEIARIDVIKAVLFERPEITQQLFDRVIMEQNTGIDGISGATVTCRAYLKSIENALIKSNEG